MTILIITSLLFIGVGAFASGCILVKALSLEKTHPESPKKNELFFWLVTPLSVVFFGLLIIGSFYFSLQWQGYLATEPNIGIKYHINYSQPIGREGKCFLILEDEEGNIIPFLFSPYPAKKLETQKIPWSRIKSVIFLRDRQLEITSAH